MKSSWYNELVGLLGKSSVSEEKECLEQHSQDKWHASALPDVVVFPQSTEEVSKVMAWASKRQVPVTTRGSGVGYVGGCVPVQGGIVLSVAEMNQIIEVSTQDGVAVVQPGVITGVLQQKVAELGWYYPPDPASLKECSIGGNIATNAGGPRCLKYGVTAHYVIGLTVVLADGSVLEIGGRCHKNKTGFSLLQLFVGSEGLLGVVTEAVLRLIPHPQVRGMLGVTFATMEEAAETVQLILDSGHRPSALEIVDAFTLESVRKRLAPRKLPDGEAYLMVEIDGREGAVKLEIEEIEELLKKQKALLISKAESLEDCEELWQLRREFSYALRDTGLMKLNEDVVIPRSQVVALTQWARQLSDRLDLPVACFGHAGDGNIHVNLMVRPEQNPESNQEIKAALDELFAWVLSKGGMITGEHGVGLAKKRWIADALGQVGQLTEKSIKSALDPQSILNPGKWVD